MNISKTERSDGSRFARLAQCKSQNGNPYWPATMSGWAWIVIVAARAVILLGSLFVTVRAWPLNVGLRKFLLLFFAPLEAAFANKFEHSDTSVQLAIRFEAAVLK
jgi:hypothetical protein